MFYADVITCYAGISARQQLEPPSFGIAHNGDHAFARYAWRRMLSVFRISRIPGCFGLAVVIGFRVVGYGDIALVRGVDAAHKCAVQRPVVRGIGQIVQIDKQVYHLVYDCVFVLLAREIVSGAETEIKVVIGVSPLTMYIAVARCAFADKSVRRTQSQRNLGQASAE